MTTATENTMLDKFRQVYADGVAVGNLSAAEWDKVSEERELRWMAEDRIPLREAAEMYALIADGYNNFEPDMLTKLHEVFGGHTHGEIEVTPARESSVAVYLHVPLGLRRPVRVFVDKMFHADEVNWVHADTLRVWWD